MVFWGQIRVDMVKSGQLRANGILGPNKGR